MSKPRKYLDRPHASVTRAELAHFISAAMKQQNEHVQAVIARHTLIGFVAHCFARVVNAIRGRRAAKAITAAAAATEIGAG